MYLADPIYNGPVNQINNLKVKVENVYLKHDNDEK